LPHRPLPRKRPCVRQPLPGHADHLSRRSVSPSPSPSASRCCLPCCAPSPPQRFAVATSTATAWLTSRTRSCCWAAFSRAAFVRPAPTPPTRTTTARST
jgi:hypothetical protein